MEEKPDTAIEKVKITDKYQLTNTTDTDIVVKAVYPFAGILWDTLEKMPVMSVNGEEITAELVIGRENSRYAKKLRENGDETAPVKVYRFKNLGYTGEYKEESRPMLKVSYTLDREKTAVHTYGAKIYGSDDTTGYECYDLPGKGDDRFGKDVYMIVMGEDITDMELSYLDVSYDEPLEGVSIEAEEYESTLGEMINELVVQERDKREEKSYILGTLSDEELQKLYLQYFYDVGADKGEL